MKRSESPYIPGPDTPSGLGISYRGLQRCVGFLALALPFVLGVGKYLIDGGPMQGSISAYYYTDMRDYFVGSLCAISVCLAFYRYQPRDNLVSNVLAVLGIVVALFPTDPPHPTTHQQIIASIHRGAASTFLLGLAYFSWFLFTKTNPNVAMTRAKRLRNRVYRLSGATIAVSLVIAVFVGSALFWMESVSVVAFAIAWLVKGEVALKDGPPTVTDAVQVTPPAPSEP
jgi:hypothetical protein